MITTFIVLLVATPFYLMADWFAILDGMPPLSRELTRASHGVIMVLVAGYGFHVSRGLHLPNHDLVLALYGALVFIAAWGITWVMVGATRSRGYFRDVHLMIRAMAKVGLGIALFYIPDWWKPNDYRFWFDLVQRWVEVFCMVTGATKLVLLLRAPPRLDPPDAQMPYGPGAFSSGENLE
jgi:hypothetical protein